MRRLLPVLLLASGIGAVIAADPPKSESDNIRKLTAFDQERLSQQYNSFQQSLLSLAQRLEKSNKQEDRDKAAALRQAIALANKENIGDRFGKLVATLAGTGVTTSDIKGAIENNDQLIKTLNEMIALLLSDGDAAKLKEEQKRLQDLLKQLDKVIRNQKVERSRVESNRGTPDELAKGQNKVTKETEDLAKAMGKNGGKDAKDGKGEPKDGKGEPKDSKGEPKDGKGEPKDSKGEPSDSKGEPKDGKGEPKDGKGEPKDSKGEPKDGKGEPKDSKGEPSDSKGEPKDGKPKQGEPKQGNPQQSDPQQGEPKDGDPQQNPDQPPPEPTRKQVKDAIENQQKAEEKLKKDERKKASDEQDEAIKKLEEARKEVERRLKQLREEEMERLLANLESRVTRMLNMQIEVYDGTKRLHGVVQELPEKKPSRNEDLKAGDLSAKEGQIVVEANKALQLLSEEGSAVAFPLVLADARDQMKDVQARLFKTDVGGFTQRKEERIIASLKEMVAAVKKSQQDLKDKKDQPPPPQQNGQQPPSKLIDALAELKMIRSLQERINQETKDYSTHYPGEQADAPEIRGELQGLAGRQDKVHRVTKDIATGKTRGQ